MKKLITTLLLSLTFSLFAFVGLSAQNGNNGKQHSGMPQPTVVKALKAAQSQFSQPLSLGQLIQAYNDCRCSIYRAPDTAGSTYVVEMGGEFIIVTIVE